MASNTRFLAPSHFTKSDKSEANALEDGSKVNLLIPPSSYEKVERNISQKYPGKMERKEVVSLERENSELRLKVAFAAKEQHIIVEKSRREAVESELHFAKRKVGDLEQEKEILQYELQDKEALAGVVFKLKKELRRTKENSKSHSEMINCLRNELKTAEKTYLKEVSNLKENSSKQFVYIEQLESKNCELKKLLEVKQLEFENMLYEKNEISEKFKGEQEISKNNLKESNQKMKNEIKKMEEQIQEDKKKVEEEKKGIQKDKIMIENEKERIGIELSRKKETCLQLENDVSLKDLKINELEDNLRTKVDDLNRMDVWYRNTVAAMETEYQLNVGKLEEMINSKDNVIQRKQKIYNENLQEKVDEIKELVQSMEQLRSYIGEIRPSQESQKLKKANEQLTSTMQVLTEENNTLHSTVKLLNVRLSSILEIAAIQESELTRNNDVIGNNGDTQRLLRKWREKVFALMIQLRCRDILEENQNREEKAKVNNLNAKVEDLERECAVLDHKLTDKEAALELDKNLKQTTTQEIAKLKEDAKVLRNQQNQWLVQFQSLHNTAHAIEKTVVQSLANLDKSVSKISAFGERIKFAGCRIHFIMEYLAHRDSNLKTSYLGQTCEYVDSSSAIGSSKNDEQHLKEEVDKLLKERSLLLSEAKKHNDVLQEKTSLITQQYETIIEENSEKIQKFNESNMEMKEKLVMLQNNLETKSQELEEALENIEELKLILTKEKATLEKAQREAFEKERLRNVEEMRNMEGQLNDVRREHTKAVMALKNAERHVSREKEKSSKMVANIEQEFSEKLAKCQRKFKNVEKERNLLMVRIKEDKKYIPRLRPVQGENPKIKTNVHKSKSQSSNLSSRTCEPFRDTEDNEGEENLQPMDPNEALTTLKELKMLSEQIIKLQEDEQSNVSATEDDEK